LASDVFREEARRLLMFVEGARLRVRSAEQGYRRQLRIGASSPLRKRRIWPH
jgi:DNA-binding transcriptional LysR family regulator